MADKIRTARGTGRGDIDVDQAKFHDTGDGSFDQAMASHSWAWDATSGAWVKLAVDHGTGALTTYISGGSLASNQSVNVAQLAGTTADTNSGSKSAGTLRVVLATDQPSLTNTLTVAAGGITASGVNLTANPVTQGGLARTSPPTAVSNAQVVNTQHDIYGKMIVRQALREDLGWQQTQISSGTAETTIVTADGTYKLDLYAIVVTNTSATGSKWTLKDSTSGTTRLVGYTPATEMRGLTLDPSGAGKQNAANNNWTLTPGTGVNALEITAFWVRSL